MQNTFYKKGYLIAVYDQGEQLVAVCDNVDEFASMFKKPKGTAKTIVHKLTQGKQSTFQFYEANLTVALIPLDPSEIEELLKEKVAT